MNLDHMVWVLSHDVLMQRFKAGRLNFQLFEALCAVVIFARSATPALYKVSLWYALAIVVHLKAIGKSIIPNDAVTVVVRGCDKAISLAVDSYSFE